MHCAHHLLTHTLQGGGGGGRGIERERERTSDWRETRLISSAGTDAVCPAARTVATQCPIGRPERWPARVCGGADLQVEVAPGQQQSREEVSSASKVTLNLGYLYKCNLTWWRGGGGGGGEGGRENGREGGRRERDREGGREEGGRDGDACDVNETGLLHQVT